MVWKGKRIFCKGFRETPRWNQVLEISWIKINGNLILEKLEFVLSTGKRNKIGTCSSQFSVQYQFLYNFFSPGCFNVFSPVEEDCFQVFYKRVLCLWLMTDQPNEPFPARTIPCFGCSNKNPDSDFHFLWGVHISQITGTHPEKNPESGPDSDNQSLCFCCIDKKQDTIFFSFLL